MWDPGGVGDDKQKQHGCSSQIGQAWAGELIQESAVRRPMQASGCGLGVQRLKVAASGLLLLLGGLHPNVRHLQQCYFSMMTHIHALQVPCAGEHTMLRKCA